MYINRILGSLSVTVILLMSGVATFAQVRPYSVSDRQVQTVLDRVDRQLNLLRVEIDRSDNTSIDRPIRDQSITSILSNLESAASRLRNNYNGRRSTTADVQDVLDHALVVNTYFRNNRMSFRAQNYWTQIRTDLDTLAGYYRIDADWDRTVVTPGSQTGSAPVVSGRQLRTLLDRLRLRNTAFRQSFVRWRLDRRNPNRGEDISQQITDYERAVNELTPAGRFRDTNTDKVNEVLRLSADINRFVSRPRMSTDVVSRWGLVRDDLDTLASYYQISWNWNDDRQPNDGFPDTRGGSFDERLTGTFSLNTSLSDNVNTAIDRAIVTSSADVNRRERVRRNLERRLTPPATLAMEKRGQDLTIWATNGQSVNLTADGVARTETSPNGRTVRTTVTTTARELTINYEGDRMNDYFVTFTPLNNDQLRVTRRVYLENENDTVTSTSVYDRTSPTPRYDTQPGVVGGTTNTFIVPNNTGITATLDSPLSTRTAQDGDRFTMTVVSPNEFRGAVIEGNVYGQRSGVLSGRANMSLSFDTIRLRNGQTYRFAGIVNQVRAADGDTISVNNEGAVRDNSQTTRTVTRAGIGAVLGAVIGAIAGGGQGAAIGAGVGAGAGAGTVVLQGRDNLELASGTEFLITATGPSGPNSR